MKTSSMVEDGEDEVWMLKAIKIAWKWRRLRMKVWRKRLLSELNRITAIHKSDIPFQLHVSWGPIYNGAAILDHKLKSARIHIQIPYDKYLTSTEKETLLRYPFPPQDLPYFILFHEFAHILDALKEIQNSGRQGLFVQRHVHADMAKQAANYRYLPFEQDADNFAYRCLPQRKLG
jgi:hypothetical protein